MTKIARRLPARRRPATRRNPNDATLRNVRAASKKIAALEVIVAGLTLTVRNLLTAVRLLEERTP